jgi:hypothetical protein
MSIIKFIAKVVAGFFIILFVIALLIGLAMPSPEEVDKVMEDIETQVAQDAEEQFRISERVGSSIDRCVQAGFVAAAWLQANNEAKYQEWKQVEYTQCNRAGVPR